MRPLGVSVHGFLLLNVVFTLYCFFYDILSLNLSSGNILAGLLDCGLRRRRIFKKGFLTPSCCALNSIVQGEMVMINHVQFPRTPLPFPLSPVPPLLLCRFL